AETFQNYIQSLNNTSANLADSTSSVDSTLSTLRDVQEQMTQVWNEYEERFSDLDTTLENLFRNVSSGLERYASQTDDYILGLDKHASEVVQSLAAATKEIADAIESLEDNLDRKTDIFESSITSISNAAEEKLKGFEANIHNYTKQLQSDQ
ncbi:hypothetical protein REH81_32775, partial [Vibrio rotiferianus]